MKFVTLLNKFALYEKYLIFDRVLNSWGKYVSLYNFF